MRAILTFLFLNLVFVTFGQIRPHMSQWASHQMAINPAHAGIKKCIDVRGTVRGQWIGVEGAPETGNLTISAPLRMKRVKYLQARHGISGNILYDQIGPFSEFNAQLGYAAHFNFTKDNRASVNTRSRYQWFGFATISNSNFWGLVQRKELLWWFCFE
jgi:type IX secretion system PorP/SprF family membrane protein